MQPGRAPWWSNTESQNDTEYGLVFGRTETGTEFMNVTACQNTDGKQHPPFAHLINSVTNVKAERTYRYRKKCSVMLLGMHLPGAKF